jgi:hypothetical protein
MAGWPDGRMAGWPDGNMVLWYRCMIFISIYQESNRLVFGFKYFGDFIPETFFLSENVKKCEQARTGQNLIQVKLHVENETRSDSVLTMIDKYNEIYATGQQIRLQEDYVTNRKVLIWTKDDQAERNQFYEGIRLQKEATLEGKADTYRCWKKATPKQTKARKQQEEEVNAKSKQAVLQSTCGDEVIGASSKEPEMQIEQETEPGILEPVTPLEVQTVLAAEASVTTPVEVGSKRALEDITSDLPAIIEKIPRVESVDMGENLEKLHVVFRNQQEVQIAAITDIQRTLITQVVDRDQELKEKDRIIQELLRQLHEKDQIIKEKDQVIKEKDQIIKEKDQIIKEKDQIIKEKDQEIKEKNKEIKQVRTSGEVALINARREINHLKNEATKKVAVVVEALLLEHMGRRLKLNEIVRKFPQGKNVPHQMLLDIGAYVKQFLEDKTGFIAPYKPTEYSNGEYLYCRGYYLRDLWLVTAAVQAFFEERNEDNNV